MITKSTIYWITRMDYLQEFALTVSITICICCLVGVIVSCIIKYTNSYEDNVKKAKRALRWFLPLTLLSFILVLGAMLIPSTKELCAIKAIPIIINNKQVQELPNKVVELANEWIDELKPNKDSE